MQIENKGRHYHPSMFDSVPGVAIKTFNKARYNAVSKELKGHDEKCSWEGYISPAACGCLTSKPGVKPKK